MYWVLRSYFTTFSSIILVNTYCDENLAYPWRYACPKLGTIALHDWNSFFFFFTKRNDLFIFSSVNNGDRSIVLTMRREGESVWNENGKFSRLFGFKIDHPYDDDLRVDLTVYRWICCCYWYCCCLQLRFCHYYHCVGHLYVYYFIIAVVVLVTVIVNRFLNHNCWCCCWYWCCCCSVSVNDKQSLKNLPETVTMK